MDLSDLSTSSVENDMSTESNHDLNANSESDNEGIDLSSSNNEGFNENNVPDCTKTGPSGEATPEDTTKVPKIKVQKDNTKTLDDGSSISSTEKDSVSNISLAADETLQASQSMLSIVSTDATYGSSSSEQFSLEEEQSNDIGDVCESQEDAESAVFRWIPKASTSNSSFTSSAVRSKLTNRSKKLDCLFTATDDTSIVHDKSSDTKNLSVKNTTAPGLFEKVPSNDTREDEGCLATGGFYDHDYNRQDYPQTHDTSVRRKVKAKLSTSSGTYSLPSTSCAPLVSNSSKRVRRSLLGIAKSMEQTREHGESQIYETFDGSRDVEYHTPKPWIRELGTFFRQINNANNKILDTEDLLQEVQYFFQRNRVKADVNLSWEENKQKILISRYFSDEFSKSHGLLTCEELMEKCLKDLEIQSTLLKSKLSVLQLCGTLKEYNISEEEFIDCFHLRLFNEEIDRDPMSYRCDPERFADVYNHLCCIETVVGFDAMLELYKKLTMEAASYNNILYKPKELSADEETFQSWELTSFSEYSSQVPHAFLAEDQSASCASYMPHDRTVVQNRWNDTEGQSSEANVSANEYAMECSESNPNVSKSSIEDEN